MADEQSQYNQIYTLGLEAGIKRDGTKFESRECTDGTWCRFQRGVPKKVGGYQQIFSTFNGIPRGMAMNSYNGVNYVYSGNQNGLDIFATGQTFGVGAGPFQAEMLAGYSSVALSGSTSNSVTITSPTNYATVYPAGSSVVFTQSANPTIYTVQSAVYNPTALVTVTISIASPCVITTGTLPTNGSQITFSTTGSLPTGLTPGVTYYVINASGATFNVATTAGGTAINTSGTQSGTQSVSFGATSVLTFTSNIPTSPTVAYLANTYFKPNASTYSNPVTLTIASPCVVTTSGTLPSNGTAIQFATTGALPTGLSTNTTYYVINGSGSTFNVSVVQGGSAVNTSGTQSGVQSVVYTNAVTDLLWQFDYQYSPTGGSLNLISHPGLNLSNIDNGVESQVYVGSNVPAAGQTWTFTGLSDSGGSFPTYRPITVDGGVCMLHPFIFVYGSNGFIANNHVSQIYGEQVLNDWNGPLANQVNVAAGKIVKGMPVRGGTSSPSGLFWATDSLIRVSFTNSAPTYWQYDIISSKISIMSSSSVVEMDGVYYWMGVDRFYVYNGYVTVLPNDKNVNYLFNNLNYEQRQKVWATKVPRYNEIWFFYPRGASEECNDAIIYNVKDKIWYDAGMAEGSQRSSGVTSEVFPTPIWGDWNYNVYYSQDFQVIATPSGQSAPTVSQMYLSGDQTTTFTPGSYISFSTNPSDPKYKIASSVFVFNTTIGGVGATKITLTTALAATPAVNTYLYGISGGYGIWQHETGLNKVTLKAETAVYSSFTTCDLSWVGGNPSSDSSPAVNRRLHLRRIEPDFVWGNGTMDLTILGRKFAQSPTVLSGPFTFDSNTEKIDLRIEYRELSLKFETNDIDGNYEMGRILITCELGDERP